MAEISNLGYVVLGVSDLARWEQFAVDLLGLQVARREEGTLLALRMDEHEQRIVLEQGAEDDVRAAGWQFDTEDALEAFVARVRALGVRVEPGAGELARARRVERVYLCSDPNGFVHEFHFGPAIATIANPFRSSRLTGKGFKTGPLGLGHLVPRSIDYTASVAFYRQVLGLKISDHVREELAHGAVADITFMHTATGRHHSLATAAMPSQRRILNHLMLEVQDMNDVGLAYDRCIKAGCAMVMELGHHPNDGMFSFYVESPSGFAIEFGHGGIVVDDDTWKVISYDKMSDWGHKRRAALPAPTN